MSAPDRGQLLTVAWPESVGMVSRRDAGHGRPHSTCPRRLSWTVLKRRLLRTDGEIWEATSGPSRPSSVPY